MKKKKRQAVALFRYGVIAPVLHAAAGTQSQYFGRMAQKELDVPGLGPRRYSVATFKSWLRRYRQEGLDGLLPKRRSDAGRSRVISDELSAHISELLARFPGLPVNRLRERLVASGHITSRLISESTLRRHIRRAGLRPQVKTAPKARKHFEKPYANDLWVMDFMHGPRVLVGRRLHKTYLAARHRRPLPLPDAGPLLHPGKLPGGRLGSSTSLCPPWLTPDPCTVTTARPSPPNSSLWPRPVWGWLWCIPSPMTVLRAAKWRDSFAPSEASFLATLDLKHLTLDDLNPRFTQWLEQDYHRRRHSGISETPLARYLRSLASIRRRTVSRAELDRVFYRTLHRSVRNDCTVSIARRLWEVPPRYIARRIEIRHPEGRPTELFLFQDDQPVARLHRVDAAQNATSPRRPHFSIHPQEDDS